MRTLLAALTLPFAAAALHAQSPAPDAVGTWAIEEKTSWIRIERQSDSTLTGRLVWVAEPLDSLTGKPALDRKNPDKRLRTRPILGMPILMRFEPDGPGRWKGDSLYDGRSGKIYRGTITMAGTDSLKLRGYIKIGFIKAGRTSVWTRVRNAAVAPDSGSALFGQ